MPGQRRGLTTVHQAVAEVAVGGQRRPAASRAISPGDPAVPAIAAPWRDHVRHLLRRGQHHPRRSSAPVELGSSGRRRHHHVLGPLQAPSGPRPPAPPCPVASLYRSCDARGVAGEATCLVQPTVGSQTNGRSPASNSTVARRPVRRSGSTSLPTRRNEPEPSAAVAPATSHTTPSKASMVASRTVAPSGRPLTVSRSVVAPVLDERPERRQRAGLVRRVERRHDLVPRHEPGRCSATHGPVTDPSAVTTTATTAPATTRRGAQAADRHGRPGPQAQHQRDPGRHRRDRDLRAQQHAEPQHGERDQGGERTGARAGAQREAQRAQRTRPGRAGTAPPATFPRPRAAGRG